MRYNACRPLSASSRQVFPFIIFLLILVSTCVSISSCNQSVSYRSWHKSQLRTKQLQSLWFSDESGVCFAAFVLSTTSHLISCWANNCDFLFCIHKSLKHYQYCASMLNNTKSDLITKYCWVIFRIKKIVAVALVQALQFWSIVSAIKSPFLALCFATVEHK